MLFVDILRISVLSLLVNGDNQKRLILHSGDDIALEFEKLRKDIDGLKANFTNEYKQEIEALKLNYTYEIDALKKSHAQEIESLKTNYTYEIYALKKSHAQEIESLKLNYTYEIDALKNSQAQEIESLKLNYTLGKKALESEITTLKTDQGSTYVRWGKTSCGGNGTEKVYSGFTAGSPYDLEGAASYICLPQHPTWAKYMDGQQVYRGRISGTEYEIVTFNPFSQNMVDQDAPCVVCRSPNPTTIMIPGRTICYNGWTMEYNGYLMTGYTGHKGGTDYACVDANPEAVYHGEANLNGKLFYFTEVKCGSLPCQEYPDGRELPCVVCSK